MSSGRRGSTSTTTSTASYSPVRQALLQTFTVHQQQKKSIEDLRTPHRRLSNVQRTVRLVAFAVLLLTLLTPRTFYLNPLHYLLPYSTSLNLYTIPSASTDPLHILLLTPSFSSFWLLYNQRLLDLALVLRNDLNYKVTVMSVPDDGAPIHDEWRDVLVQHDINHLTYNDYFLPLLQARRTGSSSDTPEVTAIFSYLWFTAADASIASTTTTIPEHILPLAKQHSPQTKHIVLTDDVHSLKQRTINEVVYNELTQYKPQYKQAGLFDESYIAKLSQRELQIYRQVDMVITATEHDKATIQSMLQAESINTPTHVARFSHNITKHSVPTDVEKLPHIWDRTGVCFVGSGRNPINQQAIEWFFQNVYPILYRSAAGPNPYLHSAPFYIIGEQPPDKYEKIYVPLTSEERASKRIRVVDMMDDETLIAELQLCRVMMSPIRAAYSGVNTQVMYGLAAGIPVMTTQAGARGIDLDPHTKMYAFATSEKDEPQIFANLLTRLYGEEQFWKQLLQKGLEAAQVVTSPQRFAEDVRVISKLLFVK